jgi:hypothetical protein
MVMNSLLKETYELPILDNKTLTKPEFQSVQFLRAN